MNSLLVSTGLVAVAEIGDKTQLLALLLACRYRKPVPIILGILVATVANHALAGIAGAWAGSLIEGPWLRWLVGLSFLAVAAWALVPDRLDDDDAPGRLMAAGAFLATLVCFFLAEMGDKTQVATVLLAARLDGLVAVVMGTTLGMLLANVPVVVFGHALASRVPARAMRRAAAVLFAGLGTAVLAGWIG
jgi:putative Ca2+/H+ antiporter (TMEM165/GDT1 family)